MSILLGLGVGNRERGPTYVIQDTFTDDDATALPAHTPDIDNEGGGWVIARWGNSYTIQTNRCDAGNWANHAGCVIDCGLTDYILTCTVRLKAGTYQGFIVGAAGSGVGDFAGWVILYEPGANRYRADDSYPGGGGEGNQGINNGARDETGATPYEIRIVKDGNTITVYEDDVEILSWTNAKYAANTCVGFYGWSQDNGTFDDFCVSPL